MTSQRARDRLVERLRARGLNNEKVLQAIARVPRHLFVDEALASRAYEDTALPIGRAQTISQPYVVALMTEALLEARECRKVLEVGTGSGYQAAVLAMLVDEVFTVERLGELSRQARRRFRQLQLRNIRAKVADGMGGWPENAPYDGIIVTAAGHELPEELFAQLGPGGVLVAPVGAPGRQELYRYRREDDSIEKESLGAVSFVPLLGGTES